MTILNTCILMVLCVFNVEIMGMQNGKIRLDYSRTYIIHDVDSGVVMVMVAVQDPVYFQTRATIQVNTFSSIKEFKQEVEHAGTKVLTPSELESKKHYKYEVSVHPIKAWSDFDCLEHHFEWLPGGYDCFFLRLGPQKNYEIAISDKTIPIAFQVERLTFFTIKDFIQKNDRAFQIQGDPDGR